MVHCAIRKQLSGWHRGEHRDVMGKYPNWDLHRYLRFDLIHQLITTISRRWCGTKAEITAPWHLHHSFVDCVHVVVSNRQAPIRHWECLRVVMCMCTIKVCWESEADRQTDGHPAKHGHQCPFNWSVITVQCCQSITHTHTHSVPLWAPVWKAQYTYSFP